MGMNLRDLPPDERKTMERHGWYIDKWGDMCTEDGEIIVEVDACESLFRMAAKYATLYEMEVER